jgi:hypothetical protein
MERQILIKKLFRRLSAAVCFIAVVVILIPIWQAPFAYAQGAGQSTWGGTSTGSANAQAVALPDFASLSDLLGVPINFIAGFTNTGPMTLAVSGTTPVAVKNTLLTGPAIFSGGEFITGNVVTVIYDGTQYTLQHGSVSIQALANNLTYYVDATLGSDSNTCTSSGAGACLTIQHAVNLVSAFNLNGFVVTINVANGTYANTTLSAPGGVGTVNLVGNPGSPSSVLIHGTNNSAVTVPANSTQYSMDGFKVNSTGIPVDGTGSGIRVLSGGALKIADINMGGCLGAGFVALNSGVITIADSTTITLSGSMTDSSKLGFGSIFATAGGVINANLLAPPTISIPSNISANIFAFASQLGITSLTYASITGVGTVTATKFFASSNGVVNSNANGVNYYPGNVAGSTTTGGQYY